MLVEFHNYTNYSTYRWHLFSLCIEPNESIQGKWDNADIPLTSGSIVNGHFAAQEINVNN
jgi:hypothetical protein